MNKTTKWLVGLVAALVVINVALVASIWLKKDETKQTVQKGGDARNYLVQSLDMTEAQTKAFDSLRKEHFERMKALQEAMRFAKDRLFALLGDKNKNEIKDSIANYLTQKIGELQEKIDKETFDHFSQLRSKLSPSQQQKFDTTIQQVLRTMAPRGGDRPPPPGGGFERGQPDGPPPGEGPDGMPPPHEQPPH